MRQMVHQLDPFTDFPWFQLLIGFLIASMLFCDMDMCLMGAQLLRQGGELTQTSSQLSGGNDFQSQ